MTRYKRTTALLVATVFLTSCFAAPSFAQRGSGKGGKTSSPGISVSTAPTFSSPGLMITTELGGTAEFRVVLDSQPTDPVIIGISSSNTAEGTVDKSSLTFTPANWDTAQTVSVTGVNDDDPDNPTFTDDPYTIVIAAATSDDLNYHDLDPEDVWLSNIDDDSDLENAIYVRNFEMETRPKGRSTEIRLSIDVRHDTDDDGGAYGESEDSDLPAAGAVVVISIYDPSGTNVRNFVGTTGDQGTGTTAWYKLPGTGDYHIEVHDVSLDGFYWDPLDELDGLDPFRGVDDWDEDGRPDLLLSL